MPFLNRCGHSSAEFQSVTAPVLSTSQNLVPGEGYDGFNKINIPAYPECLQHKITIDVGSGGSGSSSPNNNSYQTTVGTAFTNIPDSIVREEPYTNPDFIIINPVTASGSTQFFPIDDDANSYNDNGIISITAQLIDRENDIYKSYITAKTGYIYKSGDDSVLKTEQSIITAQTNYWRYSLDLIDNSLLIFMQAKLTRQEEPAFTLQFGASTVAFPQCYILENHYMYNYRNNSAVTVSYSALFFWNVHSNMFT